MDRLGAMSAFVCIVEQGSLSAAARRLDTSLAAISRRLSTLERALGTQLIVRSTRKLRLTAAGRTYFERARRILADVAEAQALLAREQVVPHGELVVSAPVLFGRLRIAPALPALLGRHAGLRVFLGLTDRVVDLIEEHVDVAVRMGPLSDSGLLARRLCTFRRILCCSPAYARRAGIPAHPSELARHACLAFAPRPQASTWHLQSGRQRLAVPASSSLRCDSQDALIEAARAGAGVTLVAPWAVAREIENGELVHVLPAWHQEPVAVHAVFAEARSLSAKTRAFVDYFAGIWGDESPPARVSGERSARGRATRVRDSRVSPAAAGAASASPAAR